MLVILALYPAVCLIRSKEWKKIGIYLLCGCVVLAPWLVRNVLISGWLIYPFAAIDLFSVDWKFLLLIFRMIRIRSKFGDVVCMM